MKLTELEKDVLRAMDGGTEREIWAIECDLEICTEKQISGVISSLIKKGIAESSELTDDFRTDGSLKIKPEFAYLVKEL